ncbi:MAG: hypothetical protein GY850_41635 [bacterium]|nr:hypothetical protein [bacterium]
MKVLFRVVYVAIILFLPVSPSTAQVDNLKEITVVMPAQSIARAIKPLLPYKIDLGKDFVGSFFVKSIDNIRIKKNKIFFTSLISGKNIKYATKFGKQVINIVVGDVNLPSSWEVSFKFDKTKNRLLVMPKLHEIKDIKDFSQGDGLLNSLLTAFSGVEYPVDLNNIKPVKSKFNKQLWILTMNITDVYTGKDKLFVEVKPDVQIDSTNKQ